MFRSLSQSWLVVMVAMLSAPSSAQDLTAEAAASQFKPLPPVFESPANPITDEKVALGRMLYFDKRLSKNQDLSCNSCHLLDKYGVDSQVTSLGHKKQRGERNSPTVYNAAGHFAQFWDGRAATVEEQAKGPILNSVEMSMPDATYVESTLRSIPGYVEAFKKAFPGDAQPVNYDNMAKAIGAFERKLVTPSRFDAFLKGDTKTLTPAEKEGMVTFVKTGCTACHMGVNVGGSMYQKLGLITPYPGLRDPGRYNATKNEADRFFFRVPTLRNVEKTAPYLHDGSVKTLDEAIVLMGKYQLGKDLKTTEVKAIATFLKSLTGELPKEYIKPPKLPPSGKDTPKPDPT